MFVPRLDMVSQKGYQIVLLILLFAPLEGMILAAIPQARPSLY